MFVSWADVIFWRRPPAGRDCSGGDAIKPIHYITGVKVVLVLNKVIRLSVNSQYRINNFVKSSEHFDYISKYIWLLLTSRNILTTSNRPFLFYKLQWLGITGKFYSLPKSMYDTCEYCVKTPTGLSQTFPSSTGVKQGPTLANIFQNDMHKIFDSECNPVTLADSQLNSLSWADDLVLMSESHAGLQRCLDKLHAYCQKWDLQVNEEKTKCMILRRKKHLPSAQPFLFGSNALENTNNCQLNLDDAHWMLCFSFSFFF